MTWHEIFTKEMNTISDCIHYLFIHLTNIYHMPSTVVDIKKTLVSNIGLVPVLMVCTAEKTKTDKEVIV